MTIAVGIIAYLLIGAAVHGVVFGLQGKGSSNFKDLAGYAILWPLILVTIIISTVIILAKSRR